MALDAGKAATKTRAIADDFDLIGKADGSAMPRWPGDKVEKPRGEAAWEYHVASALHRLSETRRNAAIKEAIRAGVMFDHEKTPAAAGTQRVVYAGPIVEIAVKVADGGRAGLFVDGFVADLIKAKVDPKLIERLRAKHRTETRPAHGFTSSLVTR